ncbi:hypothetical protein [Streptomyces xanthochromogenes]|uniref:hypothetical protein n=1 Tax=Streptomyces xanthochromogenes TaxID=67384 RepID=UPI00343FBDD5
MRHLMACPVCRETGHPPLRQRIARIWPTLELLLRHPLDDLSGLCPGWWASYGPDVSLDLLRQLSAGHLHGSVCCGGFTRHDTVWEVCVSQERFLVLDRTRIATGQRLKGQGRRLSGDFWVAEGTRIHQETLPAQALTAQHCAPARAAVAIPGMAGHRLEAAWGSLLEEIAEDLRWIRRGRSMTLQITTDTAGLCALDVLLWSSPLRQDTTPAEHTACSTARQRVVAALSAVTVRPAQAE